jgi:plasmid stabilization system protein ParE
MKAELRTTADADEMVEQIDAWWQANRPAAADLFLEELAAALALLVDAPGVGTPYAHRKIRGARRLPLAQTRYHLYYVHNAVAGEIVVLAVWSALRGAAPVLRIP